MVRAVMRLPLVYPLLAFIFARRVVINGWSMYPTLAPNEYVLFDRLVYRWQTPQRGDVVLATHPERPNLIVKRVVAVAGDSVRLQDGCLWLNGTLYGEDVRPEVFARPNQDWILREDEYFLLGDALSFSTDSRHFGPVARKSVQGRAWFVYWPPQQMRAVGHMLQS